MSGEPMSGEPSVPLGVVDTDLHVTLDQSRADALTVVWELGADVAARWGAPVGAAIAGYDVWVCLGDQCIPWKGSDRLWTTSRLRLPWDIVGQSVDVALELRVVVEWADGTRSEPLSAPFVVPPRYALVPSTQWVLGEPTVVVEDQARKAAGLTYWPDGGIGFATVDGATYGFAANGPRCTRWRIGDPDHLLGEVLENGATISGIAADVDYASGSSVWVDPGSSAVLMFVHEEIHPDGDDLRFWASIGLAVSHDGGQRFASVGRILCPNIELDNPRRVALTEVGGAPYVVRDGFFHVYFRETLASGEALNLGVARAPVEDVVRAALAGTTVPWWKYHEGAWDQPALGGVASELLPGSPTPRWFDLVHLTDQGRYVLVFSDGMADEWGYAITTSVDGIHWDPPERLGETERSGECLYLSLAGTDLTRPRVATGDNLHLYRTRSLRGGSARWAHAVVERRTIRAAADGG